MVDCVIYARVSSKEQEREGFSIPAQLELCRDYAARKGFKIAKEYSEAETAKSAGREYFSAMLKDLKRKSSSTILLVEKTDRLYRNFKDYVALEDLTVDRGLEIHLVKENEILSARSNSTMKLFHGIKVLMAKNYIDNLSEEVKKGLLQKAKDGGWIGVAPYGYTMVNRELQVDPDRAPFVKRAFELYATGLYSLRVCARKLYDEGFVYLPSHPVIYVSKLQATLSNRIYIGDVRFKGENYPGKHEPLIDMTTWVKVQDAFRKGSKPMTYQKHDFTYRGLLKCGECGSILSGELKKEGKYTYYRCSNLKQSCSQGYINESKIEEALEKEFKALRFTPEIKEIFLEASRELKECKDLTDQEELDQLQGNIKRHLCPVTNPVKTAA